MPLLGHLNVSFEEGDIFRVVDVRNPTTVLGVIARIHPNGFDDMPRWQPQGAGAKYGLKNSPRSTFGGALEAFIGGDE
jgi:hypothetical protein